MCKIDYNHSMNFNKRKLTALADECKKRDIFPSELIRYYDIQHDSPHKLAETLYPLIQEASEYLYLLNEQEREMILDDLRSQIFASFPSEPVFSDPDHVKKLAACLVAHELSEIYISFENLIKVDYGKSELFKKFPEIIKKFDKEENIIKIDDEIELADAGIIYRDYLIYYHKFLCRNFTGRINRDFISKFISYYNVTKSKNIFWIAIDPNRLIPKEQYYRFIELDTWYGPPYSEKNIDSLKHAGLTVIGRNKNTKMVFSNNIRSTEFFWEIDGIIKSLKVEELSEDQRTYYLNRFFHSQRDTSNQKFIHLDGKVNVYLPQMYNERLDNTFPKAKKPYRSVKLFRIDGNIKTEDWSEIMSYFYKGNEMVIEYLNPEEYKKNFLANE